MQAYPIISALLKLTSFEHSKLDFPVVMTSSTIKTLLPFSILKSLLNLNSLSTLSEKIVLLFSNLPNSYPTIIPPIAGDKIMSKSVNSFFILSASD